MRGINVIIIYYNLRKWLQGKGSTFVLAARIKTNIPAALNTKTSIDQGRTQGEG